jgi:hypothetical protein
VVVGDGTPVVVVAGGAGRGPMVVDETSSGLVDDEFWAESGEESEQAAARTARTQIIVRALRIHEDGIERPLTGGRGPDHTPQSHRLTHSVAGSGFVVNGSRCTQWRHG